MHFVALLNEVIDDLTDVGLGLVGVSYFISNNPALDDDFAIGKELGKDEDVGLCAERNIAGVSVPQKDLGLAGILYNFARKSK